MIYHSTAYCHIRIACQQANLPRLQLPLQLIKAALSKPLGDHVWFTCENEVDLVTHREYCGIRLEYRFGLGESPKGLRRSRRFSRRLRWVCECLQYGGLGADSCLNSAVTSSLIAAKKQQVEVGGDRFGGGFS